MSYNYQRYNYPILKNNSPQGYYPSSFRTKPSPVLYPSLYQLIEIEKFKKKIKQYNMKELYNLCYSRAMCQSQLYLIKKRMKKLKNSYLKNSKSKKSKKDKYDGNDGHSRFRQDIQRTSKKTSRGKKTKMDKPYN